MVRTVVFICLFCLFEYVHAQNQWRWVHGDPINGDPVMGTKGVSAPDNFPGGRYEALEWTDLDGNFWLMGGPDDGNDLWKYDPKINEWVWMHGVNVNSAASYGTKTVPSPTNVPMRRFNTSTTWVDKSGDLWMFGGSSAPNALWKYTISTNEWTWMNGTQQSNQAGVYGTKGVSSPDNTPGSRAETSCGWVDDENNLWMYGGGGEDINGDYGALGDLWKYNIATNEWTWVNGSAIRNTPPFHGQKGVPSADNYPGGRWVYAHWKDKEGNFWMYGGSINGVSSDMWRYNPKTDMWTWMNGSASFNDPGEYGEKCVPSPQNQPPARFENKAVWQDDCGHIWMFGGESPPTTSRYSDLWRYNVTTNEWAWIHGDSVANEPSVVGVKGIADDGNKPGGTRGGSYWQNEDGFWLFAGLTTEPSHSNVLWQYLPDTPTAAFSLDVDEQVPGKVDFTNSSFSTCNEIKSYLWNFGDEKEINDTSSQEHPSFFYNQDGTYKVKLVVTTCTGSKDSAVHAVTVDGIDNTIFVPNSFTPNGDGINDTYVPIIAGTMHNFRFQVFNRWGQLLYETDKQEDGWDGMWKGKLAELGIYPYKIEYKDNKGAFVHTSGRISLIR